MKRRVFGMILVITLMFSTNYCVNASSIEDKLNAKDNDEVFEYGGNEKTGSKIYSFFEKFFNILVSGDISEYKNDAIDTNTYLLVKEMEYKHNFYNIFYNGISDLNINQFMIKEIMESQDGTNAIVYVSANFKFNGSELTSLGSLYQVKLVNDCVVSLDTVTVENQMFKDEINIKKSKIRSLRAMTADDELAVVDSLFEERNDALYLIKYKLIV